MARFAHLTGLFVAAALLFAAPASPREAAILLSPGKGEVRGLVVGIDNYKNVNHLRGAVADARDLDGAMRRMGVKDVTTLIDDQATRAAVLQNLDALLSRTKSGDLIIISLAGHGSREDERVKGSSPDGQDEVFLLVGFDSRQAAPATDKLLNHEFNHYIKLFEDRGAQVVFVADTCYGGGLAREIDPRGATMSYRQVAKYRLAEDDLKPVSTTADAFLTPLDFQRTTFLAAVDKDTKAPEVIIDGKYRGALSYAVARALEGAADEKGDGKTTLRELFAYARKLVYQVSDERQNIVAEQSPKSDPDHVVLEVERGLPAPTVPVPEPGAEPVAPTKPAASGAAVSPTNGPASTVTPPPPVTATMSTPAVPRPAQPLPVRLAALGGRDKVLSEIAALKFPFEIVAADANPAPDLTWDPATHDAISGSDVIAHDIDKSDLPNVVDRTAAVRDIKHLMLDRPQTIRLLPDAGLHREGTRIEVEVADAKDRALVLLDITGNGTVQMLYPMSFHRPVLDTDDYRVPFRVRDPFGSDEVVAITAPQRMEKLEEALHQIDGIRAAGEVAEVITRFAPAEAKIGLVGLFTAP